MSQAFLKKNKLKQNHDHQIHSCISHLLMYKLIGNTK